MATPRTQLSDPESPPTGSPTTQEETSSENQLTIQLLNTRIANEKHQNEQKITNLQTIQGNHNLEHEARLEQLNRDLDGREARSQEDYRLHRDAVDFKRDEWKLKKEHMKEEHRIRMENLEKAFKRQMQREDDESKEKIRVMWDQRSGNKRPRWGDVD